LIIETAPPSPAPATVGAPSTPRLGYLTSRYPAVSHTFILREVLGLRARGFEIHTASINAPDRVPERMTIEEAAEAKQTYCLKAHGWRGAWLALAWALATRPNALLRTLARALQFGRGLKRVYALAYAVEATMVVRWMQRRQLTRLHVHFGNEGAAVGALVKALSGASLSITIHGPDEFDDVPGQRLRQKIETADQVICISQYARSQLMRLSDPAQWPKLWLCHLGIDCEQFVPQRCSPSSAQVTTTLPHGGFHSRRCTQARAIQLLSVGRLAPAKGHSLLLQACAILLDRGVALQLQLVGDGPERSRLQQLARDLGLSEIVRFSGALTSPEVRAALQQAHVFVLPSLAEGIPVVLMEAMASGVACVSCPVNGIPELITHEHTGLLAPPGDAESLATQLQRLATDPALRARLANAGRHRVETAFNAACNLDRLAGLLRADPSPYCCGVPA